MNGLTPQHRALIHALARRAVDQHLNRQATSQRGKPDDRSKRVELTRSGHQE